MSERIDNPDPLDWPASSTENDCKIDQQKPVSTVERRCEISRSALREDDVPAGWVQRKHCRVSHPRLLSRRHSTFATPWTTIMHRSIHLSTYAHTLQWFDNRSSDQRDRRHRIHVLLFRQETVRRVSSSRACAMFGSFQAHLGRRQFIRSNWMSPRSNRSGSTLFFVSSGLRDGSTGN